MNNDLTIALICAGVLLALAVVLFIICLSRRKRGKKSVALGIISGILLVGAIAAAIIPQIQPGGGIRLKKPTAGINSLALACDDMGAMLESKRIPEDARLERDNAKVHNMQIDLMNGAVSYIMARIDCNEKDGTFTREYQLNGNGTGFVQEKIERTVVGETVSLAELKQALEKLDNSKWLSKTFGENRHLCVEYRGTASQTAAENAAYLLDNTGVHEINNEDSNAGRFYSFVLFVDRADGTNNTEKVNLYIAAE